MNNLKRSLGLGLSTCYGLGTIVGAGIYVLLGKVVASSGPFTPLAFAVAGLAALLTGLSYAELSARFPRAAGAALYVHNGFQRPTLTTVTAVAVLLTGIVSAATIARGFHGYLNVYLATPGFVAIGVLVCGLCALACWGIRQSAWLIALITLLEVSGLVAVCVVAPGSGFAAPPMTWLPSSLPGVSATLLGAFLAFYAFIGFEDMVNIVEEVKRPERTMPLAIALAMICATFLYVLVALVAVRYTDLDTLTGSASPLAVMTAHNPTALATVSAIGVIAVVNGALVQIIMASRLLYGMTQAELAPLIPHQEIRRRLSTINSTTGTPIFNTVLISLMVLLFALALPLVALAKITSGIVLLLFTLVNLALIRIKLDNKGARPTINLPLWLPGFAALTSLALLGAQLVL